MKRIWSILFAMGLATFGWAQTGSEIANEVLVQLEPGTHPADVWEVRPAPAVVSDIYFVSRNLNVWKVRITEDRSYEAFRAFLLEDERVLNVQRNHRMQQRTQPNDPQYSDQWQLHNTGTNAPTAGVSGADIDAERAWDLATGGITAEDDTIVVCIVDDGIDTAHADLVANIWTNKHEIPNNGIDDDNNGYVDDYWGWNIFDDNDVLSDNFNAPADHGTAVAGMAGAVGNNGIGVSGINWNVKLMIVVGDGDEAEALESYDYPLTMRKRYNRTQGDSGAYVVATNTSWGVDNGRPADAPIWCAFYDSLGAAGILNAAATVNSRINIDVEGDLPTTCPSNYLIGVTSTNPEDKLATAGYGVEHIDLGAPGEGAYTTAENNGYTYEYGTSFASPLVAGVVGLLYDYACPELIELSKTDPDSAATILRYCILAGTDPLTDLDGRTATGGRLNAYRALQTLDIECWNLTNVAERNGSAEEVLVYPNPTEDELTIRWPHASGQVQVTDLRGSVHTVLNLQQGMNRWNASGLPSGIYLLHFVSSATNEPGLTQKLVVH